ncbi:MAG: methyltransferase dimerization domain-containing protein, partial [Chloroflexota bacterium]
MSNQKSRLPKPITIRQLTSAVHPSFAFLAGCQLDLFTPLSEGALTAVQLADTLNLSATKLQPLLYALVAAGLLTVENGRFANTIEAEQYLVRGKRTYMGGMHELLAPMWTAELQTAVSVRTGQPAARH